MITKFINRTYQFISKQKTNKQTEQGWDMMTNEVTLERLNVWSSLKHKNVKYNKNKLVRYFSAQTHKLKKSMMGDEKASVTTVQAPTPPVKKPSKTRLRTADMVNTAIMVLEERHGSSLQAIKKYITINYNVDIDKIAPFIRKYVKAAVANGILIQTRGKGASGSFKLPVLNNKKHVKSKNEAEEEQMLTPKLPVILKKKKVAKRTVMVAKIAFNADARKHMVENSSSRAKRGVKPLTAKPRTPKPETIVEKKAAAKK